MTSGVGYLRARLIVAAVVAAAGLAGCKTTEDAAMASAANDVAEPAVAEPVDLTFVPPTEPRRRGLYHFNRGDFGLAERYFREAVEKDPNDAASWIGLAASYDNTRRFDFADRAYATAIRLVGETTQILNNRAYSYMLRGDLRQARATFRKALKTDPGNPVIRNNIRLLNAKIRADGNEM
jgi:Flp pilus assembly protein TadD